MSKSIRKRHILKELWIELFEVLAVIPQRPGPWLTHCVASILGAGPVTELGLGGSPEAAEMQLGREAAKDRQTAPVVLLMTLETSLIQTRGPHL